MDADDPAKRAPAQEHAPESKTDDGKAKQADQQSDTEPFDAPEKGAETQKPDPKDTERKMQTGGVAAAAAVAAMLQNIPH